MSTVLLIGICAVIALLGATVWWQRQQMAAGQRWAISSGLGLALVLVVIIARSPETIPDEIPLSAEDLARWTTLSEELGRRCAQATPGPILVIEPRVSPVIQREAVRLSEARQAAFIKGAAGRAVIWQTPLYTGWWQMSRGEAEATIRPNGQALAVLWNLLPPQEWAAKHRLRLVLVLNEEAGGIQALRTTGELACVILPAKDPSTPSAFRWLPGQAKDPVWSSP